MLAAQAPVSTPFQSASLYVGDLNDDVTESVLFELFNRVGPVASIRVCRDSVTRRSLGYAYVNFHNVQDAERALDTMNFTEINTRPCRIMWSQRDPSLRKTGLGNVFVRNLAETVDNKGLYDTFSVFGNILSCKVANDETGKSKGYGYVHFETGEAAQDAIQKFNGMLIEDVEVSVSHFVKRQERTGQNKWTNIYVKQFPLSWEDAQLKAAFESYGNITSAAVSRDEAGKGRGFGFINFTDHESAAKAVAAMNGTVITEDDKTFNLYAGKAQTRMERQKELRSRKDNANMERLTKFQGMNLYVKNISDTVTDDDFKEAFTPYGKILSARIMRQTDDAKTSRGYGFVCFSTAEESKKAVEGLNGQLLGGKPLVVTLYQHRDIRKAQLAATYAPQGMRYPQVAPGVPMPFMGMYMQGQPGFPGQQPRGAAVPYGFPPNVQARGPPGGVNPRGQAVPFPARGGYFPGVPPYIQGQQGQMPRGPRGGFAGMQGSPNFAPGAGMPRGPRGAPMQQGGRPMYPGQVPMQQQYPGQPVVPGGVKFTTQARNQNQMPSMIPAQQQQQQSGLPQMPPLQPNLAPATAQQQKSFSEALLAQQDPIQQKNMIGERLFPLIYEQQKEQAGKITGMLLEMDNGELLHLLESPDALTNKVEEAMIVLRNHNQA